MTGQDLPPVTVVVDGRFNGPPASGNGGVTAGLLGGLGATVTLRQPPPLDTEMDLRDGQLRHGDLLVAEVSPGTPTLQPPPSVGLAAAGRAPSALGPHAHPFPTCFVCGPDHPTGLHLLPGRVSADLVAAAWTPADDDPVMVWAALDCPGGWSADLPGRPMVLGRMTASISRVPEPGHPHVVQGWGLGAEGRKVFTGSAVYDDSGAVLAVAEATWITLA